MEKTCVETLCDIYSRFIPTGQVYVATANTKIFGCDTVLDSFGLVSFLVDVEQHFNDLYDANIVVTDSKAMSQKHSPFRTIDTLSKYIIKLLSEKGIANVV
jgi:acyl carrier protein